MRELLQPHQAIRYRAGDFLALWRCDEASGSLVDATGNYTASVVSGSIGAAASLFDSPIGTTGARTFSNSRATAAGNMDAQTALIGEWTICAWIRPSVVGTSDRYVVSYSGGNTLASLLIRADGTLAVVWETGGSTVTVLSSATLQAARTYHVAAVKEIDPANGSLRRVRFYVDGAAAGVVSGLVNVTGAATSPQWNIGTDENGTNAFAGTVDDLAVLRYAATEEMARDVYARGASSVATASVYAADSYAVHTRVTVYTAAGVGVDLSSVYGWDLLRSIQIDEDRKSTRLNSSHVSESRMPSSA